MASIISSKICKDCVVLSMKLNIQEAKNLNGNLDKMYIIPEENASIQSSVHERGKNGCTKYFLIPKALREDVKLKKEVSCLKVETEEKIVWAYIMDKFKWIMCALFNKFYIISSIT